MTKIEEYNEIMRRYRKGEFGNRHLYLNEILEISGKPNLLYEMTNEELDYLISKTSGITRSIFLRVKEEKECVKLTLK